MGEGKNSSIPWIKHFRDIEKHLDINEKYFQAPERKIIEFEKEMDIFNERFMGNINIVEDWMKKLEKKMEN
ncbi:hypothetical protein [Ornithinibacillus halophilus]|uniref:Uncharacterized protein n=1 Tax=Ornithinibacillus halophilus TaxID=930117 RepID=A0A1M5IQA8_9BACI|nr:hypothetical protein [Ornithinibacillus halophilus]SHG30508.1 hypothetical protein SAMN05216225_102538 [Ornithinibacillus halophilus]